MLMHTLHDLTLQLQLQQLHLQRVVVTRPPCAAVAAGALGRALDHACEPDPDQPSLTSLCQGVPIEQHPGLKQLIPAARVALIVQHEQGDANLVQCLTEKLQLVR